MKHLVIVNPKSFPKKAKMESVIFDIKVYFDSVSADYLVYVSRYPRDAMSVVKKYIQETDEIVRVYSVGGDGMTFDCLNGMMGFANAELAVIPYGTSNDFVRAFGENKAHIFRDIEKQATAGTILTDVISIGARSILNFASAGVEAGAVLKFFEVSQKHPGIAHVLGKSLYTACAPLAILDKRITYQKYEITIDGVNYDGNYASINIANSACYGGDKNAVIMAHPADGFFDIILTKSVSSLRLFSVILDYTKGNYYRYPSVFTHVRGKEVSIRSSSPLQLNTDGESYYDERLDAKIVPNAVKIVAPDNLQYVTRRELA